MKRYILLLLTSSITFFGCQNPATDSMPEGQDVAHSIRWRGTNETANYMAVQGLNRYITYENNHAYIFSEGAVKIDSSLFASHVVLSFLSKGDRKEHHRRLARKFVQKENEVSKLFVSLLDYTDENDSLGVQRRNIWTAMHELTDDPFIHYMYIRSMNSDASEKIAELKRLIEYCTNHDFNYVATAANNMMAYLLKRTGALQAGSRAIDQCLLLHPEGYNPLDSRAEFYLYEGDTTKAIETYKKVLEKYPYAEYAITQLEKLDMR